MNRRGFGESWICESWSIWIVCSEKVTMKTSLKTLKSCFYGFLLNRANDKTWLLNLCKLWSSCELPCPSRRGPVSAGDPRDAAALAAVGSWSLTRDGGGVGDGDLLNDSAGEAGQRLIPQHHERQPAAQNKRIKTVPAPIVMPVSSGTVKFLNLFIIVSIAVTFVAG